MENQENSPGKKDNENKRLRKNSPQTPEGNSSVKPDDAEALPYDKDIASSQTVRQADRGRLPTNQRDEDLNDEGQMEDLQDEDESLQNS